MCDRLLASDRAVDIVASELNMTADAVLPEDSTRMQQILKRDQRTTYHRVLERHQLTMRGYSDVTGCCSSINKLVRMTRCCGDDVHCEGGVCCEIARTTSTKQEHCVNRCEKVTKSCDEERRGCQRESSYRLDLASKRQRYNNSCFTWLRLGSLLVALLAVTVQSAPTMTLENRRLSQSPKWLNPCGFASEEFEGDIDVMQLNDETLLGNIVMQAKTALNYALGFRDDYIKGTFNTDFADLHLTWKDNHYDWLPTLKQIPKQLGEQLDHEFLDKLEMRMLDTALLDAYEYMQRFAVGLEQVAWDQEDHSLDYRKQFKDTEYHLRSVLCELQMALVERNVSPRPDMNRDIMGAEFRGMSQSATFRNLRDWLIFRDYMNGLEYIIEVFEHFVRGMTS